MIWPSHFIRRLPFIGRLFKTLLKSFLWSWSEWNCLISSLEVTNLAARILEDE